jgi:hypothetical protein
MTPPDRGVFFPAFRAAVQRRPFASNASPPLRESRCLERPKLLP